MTGRTVWHRRPEPEWCTIIHSDDDAPCNRGCTNGTAVKGVPLSMGAGYPGDHVKPAHLQTVDVCLEWEPREVAPRVMLSADDPIVPMTIEEAEQLRDLLDKQIRLARSTGGTNA